MQERQAVGNGVVGDPHFSFFLIRAHPCHPWFSFRRRVVGSRLAQLYESVGSRDLVQIVILALVVYAVLHFLGKTSRLGSAMIVRGLGMVVVGLFLVAQVVIASFDLTELGKVLDYLLTTVLVGLLVIFQPELRRGLLVLGRSKMWRLL